MACSCGYSFTRAASDAVFGGVASHRDQAVLIQMAVQAGGATACAADHAGRRFGRGWSLSQRAGDLRRQPADRQSRDRAVAAADEFGHCAVRTALWHQRAVGLRAVAQRYMHEFGVTLEHLAGVAVAHRTHAMRNPKAQMRTPITLDDVARSKPISTPLRLLDCCLISDGGAAVVVSAADAAPRYPQARGRHLGAGR